MKIKNLPRYFVSENGCSCLISSGNITQEKSLKEIDEVVHRAFLRLTYSPKVELIDCVLQFA